MGKFRNLSGSTFGLLKVIERAPDYVSPKGLHKTRWLCSCTCGKQAIVGTQELQKGETSSCGCLRREISKERSTTHGLSKDPLHSVWKGMKARCYNKHHKNYDDYGGRGIEVCNEWKDDFEAFHRWAYKCGYTDGLTIDRCDVDGNYCPENCEWVTRVAQANNRRSNIDITYNGETHNLKWWSEHTGIYYGTLYHRIAKGWEISKALQK